MKKKILTGLALVFFGLASVNVAHSESPCPTGYSSVQTNFFWNDTYFSLCGCQAVKGRSASGDCGGASIQGG